MKSSSQDGNHGGEESVAAYGFVHNGRMTVDGDYLLTIAFRQGHEASIVKRNFNSGDKVAIALLNSNQTFQAEMQAKSKQDEEVKAAAMLVRNVDFQKFLGAKDEEEAAKILRERLKIDSRSELRENAEAKKAFHSLRKDFLEWKRSGQEDVDSENVF